MTFLLIPAISLLGILLITTLVYSIAGIAAPTTYDFHSQRPASPIAGFYLAEWARGSDTQTPADIWTASRPYTSPIRVRLHWRSNSMSAIPERKTSVSDEHAESAARAMKRMSTPLPLASLKSTDRSLGPFVESPKQTSPKEMPSKTESENFLVALAAQERRVLELKEELQKAEVDLTKLKRQWAHHEAIRKRQEIKQHAEPMRPLRSPQKDAFLSKAMQSAGDPTKDKPAASNRQSRRKVFEGGRHTRALSLLSPTSLVNRGSVTDDIRSTTKQSRINSGPSTSISRTSSPAGHQTLSPDPSKEDIVATGKQIMGGIKDGLWTFIEDLRQATVGDEALSPARSRQTDGTPSSTGQQVSQASKESPFKIHAAPTPRKKSPQPRITDPTDSEQATEHETTKETSNGSGTISKDASDEDEGWDNWDSPQSKGSASTVNSPTQSTPRSSVSLDTKRHSAAFEQIPWPALQKFPSTLTRTASHLMNEWEKSLSSPTEELNKPGMPAIEPK